MLFQYILLALLVVIIAKIASMHRQEPVLWGAIALIVGFLAVFFINLPYLQLLLAGVVCYILLRTYKSVVSK